VDGYTLDPAQLTELKKTLNSASDKLGMKDFKDKATLEGALTVQDVSPYENTEETVSELIRKLSKFCNTDYPNVVNGMQDFINRTHTAITSSADAVAASQKLYTEQEHGQSGNFRNQGPR
jgi:hypothetical protein